MDYPEYFETFLHHPLVQQILDSSLWAESLDTLQIILPLATLLIFAGMGSLTLTGRILAVSRKRTSYDKGARQLSILGLVCGWGLLLTEGYKLYNPELLSKITALQLDWTELGSLACLAVVALAVVFATLVQALWKITSRVGAGLHLSLGLLNALLSLLVVPCVFYLWGKIPLSFEPLEWPEIPAWPSPLCLTVVCFVPLLWALPAACGSVWLLVLRKVNDFGRDHYRIMLTWCTSLARNAWLLIWLCVCGFRVVWLWPELAQFELSTENLELLWPVVRSNADLLLWLLPIIIWTIVKRSEVPLRYKFSLVLACALTVYLSCYVFQ